jgi:hypothetical protein
MSSTNEGHAPPWMTFAEAYEEQWKSDHDLAMKWWDRKEWVENLVATGLDVYGVLKTREAQWREQVFRGSVAFSEKQEQQFRRAHDLWVRTTRAILEQLVDGLEQQFDEVTGVEKLRQELPIVEATLRDWKSPRLSLAVGLREHQLPEDAAAALDRIIHCATPLPYAPKQPVQELSAEEFKRRARQ